MALPTTENQTPLFVTTGPAWERGVTLTQSMVSEVSLSRSGLEQRQARTSRGRFKLGYSASLDRAQRAARERRARAEIKSPLWVPFWCEAGVTATPMVGDTFSMDRESTLDFFTPGDWLFFVSPTQGQQFRQIESVGITAQELVLVEMEGSIDFDTLTPIYPCRFCIREGGNAEFIDASEITHLERLTYSTL